MIQEYVADLAAQMDLKLSRVSLIDGKLLGCRDSHLLQFYSHGKMESVIVFQQDLEYLKKGISSHRLETRLRSALSRLQTLLVPKQ